MAYTCVFNHRKECDGCMRCEERDERREPDEDYLYERTRDIELEKVLEMMERGEIENDI